MYKPAISRESDDLVKQDVKFTSNIYAFPDIHLTSVLFYCSCMREFFNSFLYSTYCVKPNFVAFDIKICFSNV